MDTWPTAQLLNCIGINFNAPPWEADATAAVLAKAGFRHARMEVGWGSMSYQHPDQLRDPAGVITMLKALKRYGIRPLILLNANSGYPCPVRWTHDVLQQAAAVGSRVIYLKKTAGLKPGYSGLQGQDYDLGFPFITGINSRTGACRLSAPLRKALKKGPLNIATLRYQPFAEEMFADGKPNPAAKQTLHGWMQYVRGVCAMAQKALGTRGKANAGFDLEVWNEMTFGSDFLSLQNYYKPLLRFAGKRTQPGGDRWFLPGLSYSNHGLTRTGDEVILPMTVDYLRNPAHGLPGIKVIEGFSNTTPWANGAGMWPGQAGFSRHYYSGYSPQQLQISPQHPLGKYRVLINALGGIDRQRGLAKHVWGGLAALDSGKFFIPTFKMSQPEYWYYAYHTESVVRDLQPFPAPFAGHYRYANPGNGQTTEVWMTECNFWRWHWADQLEKQAHVAHNNPKLHALMEYEGAKMDLRQFVFQSAKGLYCECIFAAKDKDDGFGVLPDSFWMALKTSHGKLNAQAQACTGFQIKVLTRLTKLMKAGQLLTVACPLTVEKLVEHNPRLVFKGDGTPEHPNVYNRDEFACMPFELSGSLYAVGYYVVTPNVTQVWNKADSVLDPARYNMPPQTFDLTLGNIRGLGAQVSAYDPMTNATSSVPVLRAGRRSLTVRLATVDYPRFLMIREARPSPLILSPKLMVRADHAAEITFQTNVKRLAAVSWGPMPARSRDGRIELPAAKAFTYKVPDLRVQAGVRVAVTSHGLTTRWPIWGYDVAGVRWRHRKNFAIQPGPQAEKTGFYIPPLPPIPAPPSGYIAHALTGRLWRRLANGAKTMTLGSGVSAVRVKLEVVPQPAGCATDGVLAVLPELFAADRVQGFEVFDWNHAAAWYVNLNLSTVSHPSMKKTRGRDYYIAPLQKGWLVLSFVGTPAGVGRWNATIQQVRKSIDFSAR